MNAPSPVLLAAVACCDGEAWELVPGWPHEGSSCGRVRSTDRIDAAGMLRFGRMLPQLPDPKGYLYVVLLDGTRRRRVHVAVVVLEAHRGLKPGPGYEACHRRGLNSDNHLDGLYWGTKIQNRDDRDRHRREREAVAEAVRGAQEASRHLSRWAVLLSPRQMAVTDASATRHSAPGKTGRNGRDASQGPGRRTRAGTRASVTATRYGDGFSSTVGTPSIPSHPSHFSPVQPVPSSVPGRQSP